MTGLASARLLALLVPTALLAGALGSQYLGGLYPCEMCHWQRWPHYLAIVLALIAFALRGKSGLSRIFVWDAALAIFASGMIGAYHAGVERGIFEGLTQCAAGGGGGSRAEILANIMATPIVRCDQIQFAFLNVSMAGWNAIVSILAALAIAWLSLRPTRSPARSPV